MQLLAQLMDHVLARRGRADHHRRGDLRRHRRGGDRGVSRPRQRRCLHSLSGRARVALPAAADDDGRRRQRPRHRGQGHLRRLPGDREGDVRATPSSANASRWPASTRSTGRASSAQIVYYFTAAVALGEPARQVSFTVPTGNFGDIFAGYAAKRMGLPIDKLVIATNVNDILARTLETGTYDVRSVDGDDLAFDGHPGLVEFRAAAVRGHTAATRRRARADGRPRREPAPSPSRRRRSPRSATDFAAGRADEAEVAATIARRPTRETGFLPDPHTAVGLAVAATFRRARRADGYARHRPSGEIRRRGQGRDRAEPRASRRICRILEQGGAFRNACQ